MEAAYPFCAAVCHNIVDKGLHVSLSLPLAPSLTHKDAHTQNADSHRNVWTHTVYIMRYAHTVNRPIRCVYTLNLTNSYTNKSKSSLKSDQLQ